MIKYTFKTYIFNGTEHYAYGEEDARGTTMFSQQYPFPTACCLWLIWMLALWSLSSENSMTRFGSLPSQKIGSTSRARMRCWMSWLRVTFTFSSFAWIGNTGSRER